MKTYNNVEVVIPLYNGEKYIPLILEEFADQRTDFSCKLHFVLTNTGDKSEEILKQSGVTYDVIEKKDFSHSLTRENAVLHSKADAVIFLTQDCRLVNSDVYQKLVMCLSEEVKFAYLRQVNSNKTVEKYSRRINYPNHSIIKDKTSIEKMGINAFFASDACSVVDVEYFKSIHGYDGLNLPTSEDMYYAYKVIQSGKKVMYCADSFVDHTHKFTLHQLYQRYYLVGEFFALCPQFKKYHANNSGLRLASKIALMAIKEFNIGVLFAFVPNMLARYLGKKNGEREGRKSKQKAIV